MVRNTEKEYPDLYRIVSACCNIITNSYNIMLSDNELSTIVLIINNALDKNTLYGTNKKKVLIVTNTAYLDINETDLIPSLDFEYILLFQTGQMEYYMTYPISQ